MMLKEQPEDFIVEEIAGFTLLPPETKGPFAIYKVWKRQYTTESAVHTIAYAHHVPLEKIKYAGTKDKQAITTQYISIQHDSGNINHDAPDLKVSFVGFANEPLSLGSLKGNIFRIKIRDLDTRELSARKIPRRFFVPNYFDEQRFSKNNVNIGLALLRKEFKSAAELIHASDEKLGITSYLHSHPGDYVGAFRLVPRKILLMYIHAVQSSVYNELLTEHVQEWCESNGHVYRTKPYDFGTLLFPEKELSEAPTFTITLPGFNSKDSATARILQRYGLVPRDFIIRALPEVSVEGSERQGFMEVNEFHADPESRTITFRLDKGCYATIVCKALFDR